MVAGLLPANAGAMGMCRRTPAGDRRLEPAYELHLVAHTQHRLGPFVFTDLEETSLIVGALCCRIGLLVGVSNGSHTGREESLLFVREVGLDFYSDARGIEFAVLYDVPYSGP